MALQEMYNCAEQQIQKQGSASSKVLAPLFKSMLEYMGENNDGLVENAKTGVAFTITLNPTVLEKYNNSQDWTAVKSAVEANGKIIIA